MTNLRHYLDHRISDRLREFNSDNNGTFYRVWTGEGFSVSIQDRESLKKDSFIEKEGELLKAEFSVSVYMPTRKDSDSGLIASAGYISIINTNDITTEQLERLFFLLNGLLDNSKNSGLKGIITQRMNLQKGTYEDYKKGISVGSINTTYETELPQFSENFQTFTDRFVQSDLQNMREMGGGECKVVCDFKDGVMTCGWDYGNWLGFHMDSEGNVGTVTPKKNYKLIEEYIIRDLEMKKQLKSRII